MIRNLIIIGVFINLLNTNLLAQEPFYFVPKIKESNIYLHDTIYYPFTFINLLDEKIYLMYQRNLLDAKIEYKFNNETKWNLFLGVKSSNVFGEHYGKYPYVEILPHDTLSYKNAWYCPTSDSVFLYKYKMYKPKSFKIRFFYAPYLLVNDNKNNLESLIEADNNLKYIGYSDEIVINLKPYIKQDKKAIEWLFRQNFPLFLLRPYIDYEFDYYKSKGYKPISNNETTRKIDEFYKLFPRSRFITDAKVFEADYYILNKNENPDYQNKSYKILWEIVENNSLNTYKKIAIEKLKVYYPKDVKLNNYLKDNKINQ